jgi:peptide subunit release factor 1 (eRF1)
MKAIHGIILTSEITSDLRGMKGLWQCPHCHYKKNKYDSIKNIAYVSCEKCDSQDEVVLDIGKYLKDKEVSEKRSKFKSEF